MNSSKRRLTVYLLRPSRYDDAGYLVRHMRGVIPSNTLATMHGLNLSLRLPDTEIDSVPIEDVANRVRTVPLDSPLIAAARAVGTSFGD